jgi:hypothetical protein
VKDNSPRLAVWINQQPIRPTQNMNFTKNIGMLLLAIYLIIVGVNVLVGFVVPAILIALLALFAGIMILIGK